MRGTGRSSRKPSSARVIGPLAEHVPGFIAELVRQGYAEQSVRKHLWRMAHLSRWLQSHAMGAPDLTTTNVAEFLKKRRAIGFADLQSERGLRPLLEYLRGVAAIPTRTAVVETPLERLLADFRHYLVAERGLVIGTVQSYECRVRPLLEAHANRDCLDLKRLTAAEVARFVLTESRRRTVASATNVVTAVRGLLRFLYLSGQTSVDLTAAVPTVASWRAVQLPRALASDEVVQLLSGCDRATNIGRRDFAIITMLARLGLRAGEVASLELEDFDWIGGEIVVRGKGSRQERLPLPADVGEAVTVYLLERPHVECRRVFLRSCAPVGGLTGPCVGQTVRRACERAGISPVGAHRLRHTAATAMLREGASLPEVGQVLRHRTLIATAIYAKVDRVALRALARPWPEARP